MGDAAKMPKDKNDIDAEFGPYHRLALSLAVLAEKVNALSANQNRNSLTLDGSNGKESMSNRIDLLEERYNTLNKTVEELKTGQTNTAKALDSHLLDYAPLKSDVLSMRKAMLAGISIIVLAFLAAVTTFFIKSPTIPANVPAHVVPVNPQP